jgi:hypothetical protein
MVYLQYFRLARFSRRSICALAMAGLFLVSTTVNADTDVVEFKNGDRLTGEVKKLVRGRLSFDTDATGVISIDWEDIRSVNTDQKIQIEVVSGARYFGSIGRAENEAEIMVETDRGPVALNRIIVVGMHPIDAAGFRGMDLSVSVGYNFTKASDVTQFNVGVHAAYRTLQRIVSADFSSIISDSANNDSSQRQSLGFNYTRLRANRWLNDGGVSFDRNEELGLNLRSSISAGGGRIISQTNNSQFLLTGGLKATRENNVNEPEDVDSLESYGEITWEWYRYDSPKLDWTTSLELIPSLTESGRVRGEFDATLSWELFSDLFWKLEFYDSFDSQPQSDTAEKNDYGVTTSVSYKF